MKKIALFAFNGEAMCFIHVLLNGIDMKEKGCDAKIIIEGAATKLIPDFEKPDSTLYGLYRKALERDIIDGACRACANKMGTLTHAEKLGMPLLDDMSGHPSMNRYLEKGFEVITF